MAESMLSLSGERFRAVYRLHGPAAEVEGRARAIALEQTVEFPDALLPHRAARSALDSYAQAGLSIAGIATPALRVAVAGRGAVDHRLAHRHPQSHPADVVAVGAAGL